ncbi:MAG: hypothetical protein O7G28_00345 [Deltaproteobacteria bacterium]|nr:hypothetical protein [Deltaproteobacteria bacterium]MCZ6905733.1 hypothetical protein [Deltaproteobacteria bacterium]
MGTKLAETEVKRWLRGQKVATQWIEGGTHSFLASTDTSGVLTNLPLRADFDYGWQGSSTAISTPMENAPGIETLCAAQAEATRTSIFETAAEVADFLDEQGVP